MIKLEAEARGASEEIEKLSGPFIEKVIPRLLRPLETKGRSITPVLIHGDLWLGNVSIQDGSENPLMFDASAFWGHNSSPQGKKKGVKKERRISPGLSLTVPA